MPPSPLGLLEERREAARARVEVLEAELERLDGELRSARAVLERRVVAVEELVEALAPAEDAAGPAEAGVRVPPKGAVVPVWREGLDPVDALAPDYRRLVERGWLEVDGSGGRFMPRRRPQSAG